MNPTPVTVVAYLKAKPGLDTELHQALAALVEPTRTEPGCLNYDLHRSNEDPTQFMFHENWTSKQHLDDHLARPHLLAFLGRAGQLLAEPPRITLWTRLA